MIAPIFSNKKRVILFTNYRSGSTTFCNQYILQNKIPQTQIMGECFGAGLFTDIPYTKIFNNLCSHKKFFIKFMASHVCFDTDKCREVLSKADLIMYLYRKDFAKQAKSFISADRTNSFYAGNNSPTTIKVPSVNESYVKELTNILKKNYEHMVNLHSEFPGPVYCYEDINNDKPYTKTTVWTNEPDIELFDVEGLFKDHGLGKYMV